MVEFADSRLLRRGYTPLMLSIVAESSTIYTIEFEYMCGDEANIIANVYLRDDSGDFTHSIKKVYPTQIKTYKRTRIIVKTGQIIREKMAWIRLWTEGEVPIRVKNLNIVKLHKGESKEEEEEKHYYDYYKDWPKQPNVAIIRFHNALHAVMLSKQTGYPIVEPEVGELAKYDIVIFLAPFNMRKIDILVDLRSVSPKTKVIIWWVGSDVLYLLGDKQSTDMYPDKEVLKWVGHKNVCVSETLQKELATMDIDSEVVTLIPNVEKYNPCSLPDEYTVGVYLPSTRLDFYGYKEAVQIMNRTPNIKYLVYGNTKDMKLPKNAKALGWVEDTTKVLESCNCLLRLTKHDGFPHSIIEAIMMGRYVIINHQYPDVKYLTEIDDIVEEIKRKPKLNPNCTIHYNQMFNNEVLKRKLRRVIDDIEINIPHPYGKNNGVATHISVVKKYSRYGVLGNYGGKKIINTHAIGKRDIPKIDVYTAHSYYDEEDYDNVKPNVDVVWNANKADRIICVSNYVKDFLVANGVNEKKMMVIPNPVDLEEIDMIQPNRGLPKHFSLFIGDKKVKRPELLVKLAKKFPNDSFVSIGYEGEMPPNVMMMESVSRGRTLQIMKACDIYLCLSKRESCPYTLLEAMIMKRNCIISDFAGQKEIITNGVDGAIFEADNIKSLCAVYKDTKDKNYGDEARETIEKRFDARLQVPKYDSVYVPPKVSIITFVYCTSKNKRLEQLKECIDSIASQGYKSYEHIIVDDGSTIPLHKEILAMKDPHLIYYLKPHTGITKTTKTFNYGLKVAQGRYIMFLASDDIHLIRVMKLLSEYLDKHPNMVAVFGNHIQQTIKKDKVVFEKEIIWKGAEPVWDINEPIKDILMRENCISGCAIMFRKEVLPKITLPPKQTGFCSDYDLWMKISEFGDIGRIDDVVIEYRRFEDATSLKTSKDMPYRNKCIAFVKDSARKRRKK